jgi:Bacterial tandem repeat domain 1
MFELKKSILGIATLFLIALSGTANAGLTVIEQIFHFQTSYGLQENVKQWGQKGMAPKNLSAYTAPNGGDYYAGSFEPISTGWYYVFNSTPADFGNQYAVHGGEGLRITDMSVNTRDGVPAFSGIWSPADGKAHAFYFGMTDAEMAARGRDLIDNQGYRIEKHIAYFDHGQIRNAVTYIKDGQGFYFYYGMNGSQLKQKSDELAQQGFSMAKISALTVNGQPVFSAVYLKVSGFTVWQTGMGTTNPTGFVWQNKVAEMKAQGYSLVSLATYNMGQKIGAVWYKSKFARRPRIIVR